MTYDYESAASNPIVVFAQRSLGSPQGKHCNSLERNVWRKVVPTSKKTILERDYRFFDAVLSEMDLGNVDTREVQLFVRTTLKYVVRKTDQHFSMRKVYYEPGFAKLSRDLEILVINRQEINQ